MPRKRKSTKPLRPPRKSELTPPSEPVSASVRSEVRSDPISRSDLPPRSVWAMHQGRLIDFEGAWASLTSRQRDLARYAADQRGVTLRALLEKWPEFRG